MRWVSTFSERFRELTLHQAYQQISDFLGIIKSTVSYYITGQRKPKTPALKYIASKYAVSPLWLLGGDVPRQWTGSDVEGNELLQYSEAALHLAQVYDTLDQYGKDVVREVAEIEKARCKDEERFLREADFEEEEEIVIDEFTFRPAAGPLTGVAGQERVPYVLKPEDPRGAVYTTIVEGDSMEPYFPDGSRIFVNMDQVRDGDVGVFCVDGAMVIKQYHHDPRDPLGMTYLFSLNRKRANMDIVFSSNSGQTVVCQGRVMTKQHFPIPGR